MFSKSISTNAASPLKAVSRRYFFHALTRDGIILDHAGIELDPVKLNSVRKEIVEAVLESTMDGSDPDDGSTIIGFVVADDFGRTVLEIPAWEMMGHYQLLRSEPSGAA